MTHIVVELTMLSTDHGGRKTSVSSGYRPQFYYDSEDHDAIHQYSVATVQPGDTTIANLTFLNLQTNCGKLYRGQVFLILEGNHVVGYGRIVEVCDPSLLRIQRYLYVFGYCTPTQTFNNDKHGWDDEDSAAIFIDAPTEHDALYAGRTISERSVRRLFQRHRWLDGGPSWLESKFAHWIEHKPLERFSGIALDLLPVVQWNDLPSADELIGYLGMDTPENTP